MFVITQKETFNHQKVNTWKSPRVKLAHININLFFIVIWQLNGAYVYDNDNDALVDSHLLFFFSTLFAAECVYNFLAPSSSFKDFAKYVVREL